MTITRHKIALVIMLGIHCGLLAQTAWKYSPVTQEGCQLVAGVTAWRLGRFDLFHVNPPLVRLIATLPTFSLSPKFDTSKFDRPPVGREEHAMAKRFSDDNADQLRQMYFLARLACIPFSLIGGYVCWKWANELFGGLSGLVSSALWCFSPYILGNASTIMVDVPAAALGVLTMYWFWRWLKAPRWKKAIAAGVLLGLAELCKFTLLVLYPLLPAIWLVYRLSEKPRLKRESWAQQSAMLGVMFSLSVYAINCAYVFEGSLTPLHEFHFRTMALTGCKSLQAIPMEGANRFAGSWLEKLPVPLPANFVQGIDTQRYDFEHGLPSYLRGEWAQHGWWYYYLYALAIKTPLGTLCLIGLAIGLTVRGRGDSLSWRKEMVVLVPFIAILGLVSSQTGFSVHSRYMIPAFPFLFIWTSKVARDIEARSLTVPHVALRLAVAGSLAWSIGSTLTIYPHCISYFNELASVIQTPADPTPIPCTTIASDGIVSRIQATVASGPRNGPRHLLDSNIDWSQDLFYLEDWCASHPESQPLSVAYFGSYPLAKTKIQLAERPPGMFDPGSVEHDEGKAQNEVIVASPNLLPGWYAVGVNEIFDRSSQFRYFRNLQPVATVGYSIYIYHITPQAAQASASD